MKPHLGRISDWSKYPCVGGLDFFIVGHFVDHPEFAGEDDRTSYVVDMHDHPNRIEIETRNSRYTLLKGDNP